MVKLRLEAGNVLSPQVHQIGILALGSHLENHGPALPIDTDAKIASYIALEASLLTGAKFLGVLYAATEFPYIPHGIHVEVKELVNHRLKPTLKSAKKCLNLKQVVLVNGHGGNVPICNFIKELEEELDLEIVFNNRMVEIEGPHAGSGELSIGTVLGITSTRKLKDSCNLNDYPEVGMCGFKEARQKDAGIDEGARVVEKEGTYVDPILGQSLLDKAIKDIMKDVKKLLEEDM
ncbi:MAG: 2-amino-5-formylamino-6-ribosylaminopyrimidin-4(3H)-one 5'-monophosphate deformylase [Euryarchaeota archaeon]|nr:2-amino-5-formylamino-6-ribosylaminopyrimidin-4(3H)-one 5'-monophosphate deformylase [Euryarchaeota archaeon]MBU4608313.1 2-amino-5-formylamino-6-ribosylaminopyrimidin-4(3H)-one 5'-monophosphate deformylase [Euryarchaeota archaeon]MBV1729698.1 2-amino-5-formylamino-6-ribosylaminopyrimidin-4(3H)-one 5'-monophosphate deformylase [Methanobacterium sp.]MBV1755152.1 2-amino-5-formylamino-6-ribosylaminopyrimidin-4(3H)-one 5'-monophosphate deformylase [Methanobacterium sp.]